MSRKQLDWLLFGLLASFWGGSFVAIKFVVRDFPPVFGAMLRVGLALLILGGVFRYQRRSLAVPLAVRRRMWLGGLLAIGLPFSLLFYGERMIAPGLAGIINGTVPLWTFLLGIALGGDEKFSARKLGGLGLGLIGIGFIFAPLVIFGGSRGEVVGTAAVFAMAVSYGAGSLLNRSLLSGGAKVDFRANIFHQHCAAFAFLAVLSLALEPWPSLAAVFAGPAPVLAVAYLGLFSTAAAFLIYFHLIREWGAVRASAVTYVAPIIAVFWDYVFFGNVPRTSELLGVAAILAGVVLMHAA